MNILVTLSLFCSSYKLVILSDFYVTIMHKLTVRDLFVNNVLLVDS